MKATCCAEVAFGRDAEPHAVHRILDAADVAGESARAELVVAAWLISRLALDSTHRAIARTRRLSSRGPWSRPGGRSANAKYFHHASSFSWMVAELRKYPRASRTRYCCRSSYTNQQVADSSYVSRHCACTVVQARVRARPASRRRAPRCTSAIRAATARAHVERMIGVGEQLERRARAESRRRRGLQQVESAASSSRVPCRNSIGTCTSARCAARSSDGLPAGCSGKPRNASPRTPGNGIAACACDVMRPPNDLPPAMSATPGRRARRFGDRRAHRGVRDGRHVGTSRALLHVRKLIAQRRDAARRERVGNRAP